MFKRIIAKILDLKLKRKAVLFIAAVMVPFILLMVFILNSLSRASTNVETKALEETTSLVKQELLNSAINKAQVYDLTFKNMIIDLEGLKDSIIEGEFKEKLLTSYYYKHQIISSVFFINKSDSIFISPESSTFSQDEVDLSEIKEFSFLFETEKTYAGTWVGPYEDFKSQKRIITYILPIWRESEFEGVVGIDISIDSLFTEIVRIDPSQSSYFFMTKSDGEFLSSSEEIYKDFKIEKTEISNIFDSKIIKGQEAEEIFRQQREGAFTIQEDNQGSQKIVAFSAIPSFGGKMVIVSPLSEIIQIQKEKAREIQEVLGKVIGSSLLYMIVIMSFIGFLTISLLGTTIINPITRLKEGIENIRKERDFNLRVEVESKDEVGGLAQSFNQLTGELKNTTVSKDYVDNIIKSMSESLVVVDSKLNITRVNKATIDLLGYKEGELIGNSVKMLFGEEKSPFDRVKQKRSLEQGQLADYETTYITKSDKSVPIIFSSASMRNKKGNIISIVCLARDITERKKTEREMEKFHKLTMGREERILELKRRVKVLEKQSKNKKL